MTKVIELVGSPYDGTRFLLNSIADLHSNGGKLMDGESGIALPGGWFFLADDGGGPTRGRDFLIWEGDEEDMAEIIGYGAGLPAASEQWFCVGRCKGGDLVPMYFGAR